VAKKKLKKQ